MQLEELYQAVVWPYREREVEVELKRGGKEGRERKIEIERGGVVEQGGKKKEKERDIERERERDEEKKSEREGESQSIIEED